MKLSENCVDAVQRFKQTLDLRLIIVTSIRLEDFNDDHNHHDVYYEWILKYKITENYKRALGILVSMVWTWPDPSSSWWSDLILSNYPYNKDNVFWVDCSICAWLIIFMTTLMYLIHQDYQENVEDL